MTKAERALAHLRGVAEAATPGHVEPDPAGYIDVDDYHADYAFSAAANPAVMLELVRVAETAAAFLRGLSPGLHEAAAIEAVCNDALHDIADLLGLEGD